MTTPELQRSVMVVAGARPNFMKVVPILHELARRQHPHVFVHTGQHYDVKMSEGLLRDLNAPEPNVMLGVGSGSHAVQTARIMERFEGVLLETRPAWVVVVGDVNSTLACALVTAKLSTSVGARIAHVEAGLRSRDWSMPEEINRVLTDRLSHLLLTPSADGAQNLRAEGIDESRVQFVGNVMIDALYRSIERARHRSVAAQHGLSKGQYVLATLHRPSNVDDPVRLRILMEGLNAISNRFPVLFPVHPRTRAEIERLQIEGINPRLTVIDPLGYLDMLSAQEGAAAVVTDSGGVQEETTVLGVPCVTVRAQTERPITVLVGTNRMATWPPSAASLVSDIDDSVSRGRLAFGACAPEGWDGLAAERIVEAIMTFPGEKS